MSAQQAPPNTVRITYREAMRQAMREALIRDPRVFLMGEDVGRYGGCLAVSKGLLEEFGPERIRASKARIGSRFFHSSTSALSR